MKILFVILISGNSCFAMWGQAKELAEKAADMSAISEAITELSTTISEENDLNNHLDIVKKSSSELRQTLQDLDYTQTEIDEILKGDQSAITDLANTITRTNNRIKRAKSLVNKVLAKQIASPEAVTATQSLEMSQTLREINSELAHQRMDRQLEKDRKRSTLVQEQIERKKKEAFFKRQFSLMEKSSRLNNVSYHPFKENPKTEPKSTSYNFLSWVL